jgi:hypothetical protein
LLCDGDSGLVEAPHTNSCGKQAIKNPHDLSVTAGADIGLAGVLRLILDTFREKLKVNGILIMISLPERALQGKGS